MLRISQPQSNAKVRETNPSLTFHSFIGSCSSPRGSPRAWRDVCTYAALSERDPDQEEEEGDEAHAARHRALYSVLDGNCEWFMAVFVNEAGDRIRRVAKAMEREEETFETPFGSPRGPPLLGEKNT